jgi:hypothetical protein
MIWIIGILVISCVAFFVWRGVKGPAHTLETIEKPIKDLLKRGYDGGFLILSVSRSKCFVQLRKYIKESGLYGIELCFPNANWSAQYFEALIDFCIREDIEYLIAKENTDGPLEFLYIDFNRDIQKAHRYIKKIFKEILGVDENVKLYSRLENASVEDKLIDK